MVTPLAGFVTIWEVMILVLVVAEKTRLYGSGIGHIDGDVAHWHAIDWNKDKGKEDVAVMPTW